MRDRSVKIQVAETGDYSSCLPLFKMLYHDDVGSGFRQTFEDFVKNKEGVVLFVECFRKVIGVLVGSYHRDIDWEGKTARIDALIVDKANRRSGIGRKLVRHFITLARTEGCRAVKSRINRKNKAAQGFHVSLGFTRANTYEYFLELQGENNTS